MGKNITNKGKDINDGIYDNAVWIVYSDTTHARRQMYWLTRYDGGGNVVDELSLG